MPYHVYTRSGPSAFGVIVETARDAVTKARNLLKKDIQRS